MKIFISHSSENKVYGDALVELLRAIGIPESEIIYTSNPAYGIPIGQNIFNWLKCQITENPYVIYLLSKEYYSSIACLNEMGAAWVIENMHTVIFTPGFDLSSKEFQSGAIDPREMGFFVNDEDRLVAFIEQIGTRFNTSKNSVLVNQYVKKYLSTINSIIIATKVEHILKKKNLETKEEIESGFAEQTTIQTLPQGAKVKDNYSKFLNDIIVNKLTEEEKLLLHYIITRGKTKLKTGWQEESEISEIKSWEEIEGLNNKLSQKYAEAIRKFNIRGYTVDSAFASSGKPKEVKIQDDLESMILDFPHEVIEIINQTVDANQKSPSIDW